MKNILKKSKLVSSRSKLKKRKKSILKLFVKKKEHREKLYKFVRIAFFGGIVFLFFIIIIIKVLQNTIFDYGSYFHNVSFTIESKEVYDDPYLYSDIVEFTKGMNKYEYFTKGSINLSNFIKDRYFMVDNIYKASIGYGSIILDIKFKEPSLIIQNNDKKWGIYSDINFIPLYSGNKLGVGQKSLFLPKYLSGYNNMTGLFYTVSVDIIKNQFNKLQETIPHLLKIVYFAGGEKLTALTTDYKKLFFDCKKDIDKQIENYIMLYNDRFVSQSGLSWSDVVQIDLGSLEQPIVMSK